MSPRAPYSAGQKKLFGFESGPPRSKGPKPEALQSEQFSKTFGLRAANGDFGLFLVVHPELI